MVAEWDKNDGRKAGTQGKWMMKALCKQIQDDRDLERPLRALAMMRRKRLSLTTS